MLGGTCDTWLSTSWERASGACGVSLSLLMEELGWLSSLESWRDRTGRLAAPIGGVPGSLLSVQLSLPPSVSHPRRASHCLSPKGSWPDHLPKVPPPNAINLGLPVYIWIWGRRQCPVYSNPYIKFWLYKTRGKPVSKTWCGERELLTMRAEAKLPVCFIHTVKWIWQHSLGSHVASRVTILTLHLSTWKAFSGSLPTRGCVPDFFASMRGLPRSARVLFQHIALPLPCPLSMLQHCCVLCTQLRPHTRVAHLCRKPKWFSGFI